MADKSTSTERTAQAKAAQAAAAETPPRKIYPIVKYGDAVLEKPGAIVRNFDTELAELAEDMFASMYAAQGVGLAAPQIGKSLRLAVVDVSSGKNPEAKIVLANQRLFTPKAKCARKRAACRFPASAGMWCGRSL